MVNDGKAAQAGLREKGEDGGGLLEDPGLVHGWGAVGTDGRPGSGWSQILSVSITPSYLSLYIYMFPTEVRPSPPARP